MFQRRLCVALICLLMLCAGCCSHHCALCSGPDLPIEPPQIWTPPPGSQCTTLPPVDSSVPTYYGGCAVAQLREVPHEVPHSRFEHLHDDMGDLWPNIKHDYRDYYSWENFVRLAAGFSVGAVFADTPVDQSIRDKWQNDVRSSGSDSFAKVAKDFGTGGYMLPAMAAAWMAGDMFNDWAPTSALGEWGERSIRSGLVGAPPMLFAQYATGSSRPVEPNGSHWHPFKDNNGVSGHAFIGGLVFIDAAKMTDNPWLKAGWYACSVMPAWSRVNDDAHYTSQAILGWWMAYCAATAVDETYRGETAWHILPIPADDGVGLGLTYQY